VATMLLLIDCRVLLMEPSEMTGKATLGTTDGLIETKAKERKAKERKAKERKAKETDRT